MNADNFNMVIEDANGKEVECSIIARWHDINDYIAYINGSKTDNELDLFISKCLIVGDTLKLEPITDDDEWNRVNMFLDNYLHEGEEK